MKKNIILLFCFFLLCFSYAQQNLVGNAGFENVLPGGPCTMSITMTYDHWVTYWSYEYPWTCPASPWYCPNKTGVGTSDWNCDGGHTGIHYGFCAWREYIVQNIAPMVQGHVYYIEYWVKGKTALNAGGLCLFKERPKQCGASAISPDRAPQAPIPYGTDLTNWTKISSFYEADENYKWIGYTFVQNKQSKIK